MSVSLYRKWRPQAFSEMAAQDHVSRTIKGALRSGRLAHAFVFAGPRGTGKTTMARILARAVNCPNVKDGEPCGKCDLCTSFLEGRAIDLIEIDAASNRGIDDIRELRESIRFSPTESKKKVYIIDEAHMLTKEAFNALLKTLEEPPEYAMFILATTEAERLPETILSRCQRFDFRPVKAVQLKERLSLIAKEEKIVAEDGALDLIILQSGGSFRDAISLLDQLSSTGEKITSSTAQAVLGLTDAESVRSLGEKILATDSTGAIMMVREALRSGRDISRLTNQLIDFYRTILLYKFAPELESGYAPEELLEASAKYQPKLLVKAIEALRKGEELSTEGLPSLGLELAIVSLSYPGMVEGPHEEPRAESAVIIESQPAPPAASPPKKEEPAPALTEIKPEKKGKPQTQASPETSPDPVPAAVKEVVKQVELAQILEAWPQILNAIKPYNHSIAAFLLVCKPTEIISGRLILAFPYKFHRERISELRNRQIVEKVIEDLLAVKLTVDCILAEQGTLAEQLTQTEPADSDDLIDTALEIFGGRVVS